VGANIGGYSLFTASYGAEVFAFEPSPSTFKLLERNISINPTLAPRIHTIQKVVSDSVSEVDFTTDLDTVNKIVTVETPRTKSTAVMKVPAVTLDSVLEKVNAMKIDVEGFERSVLRGAKRILSSNELKLIVLEEPDEEIISILSDYGFKQCRYDIKSGKITYVEGITNRPNGIFVRG
jgi:FkbM family methyltransferase